MQVIVLGTLALDTIETVYGRRENILGGSAVFAACAACYLAPTGIIGIVGSDFPEAAWRLLASLEIDTTGIRTCPGRTFHWEGRYRENMMDRDTLCTELGVFAQHQAVAPEQYRGAECLVLGNISPVQQLAVLDSMQEPEFVVADTMNFYIQGERSALEQLIPRCDLFVVNDEEARMLTDETSLTGAARRLLERGPGAVVIKRGEHGASLHTREDTFYVPAVPLEIVRDPTGAGDAFLGGLAGYVARSGRVTPDILRQALVVGSALASFAVEDSSVERLVGLDRRELLERCTAIRMLTGFSSIEI
jgi:sugar/nucleoside kinase (ribokinase family)